MFENHSIVFLLQVSVILIWFTNPVPCELQQQRRIDNFRINENQRNKRAETDNKLPKGLVANESIDDDVGLVRQKLSTKIKFQPVVLPKVYNKLQVPSQSYANTIDTLLAELFSTAESEDWYELWKPLTVTVTLRIGNVNDVSEIDEDITFAADLMLEWTDGVIRNDGYNRFDLEDVTYGEATDPYFKTLDSEFLKQIWKPDVYIMDLVKVTHPELMSPPVTVRLNEVTGEVIYVSRVRIQMECEMDFHYYPADTQNCEVEIRSNSYSSDELDLTWAESGLSLEDCGGSDYDFQLTSVEEGYKNESYVGSKTREFAALGFTIVARRKLSYHMVQTFLPSVFFIFITWLCFLIPPSMVEARIGIAMTTLLTLTAMFASIREGSPTVSYVRAIDIWMISTIFFVFLTLLEFTVLVWLQNTKEELETEADKVNKVEQKPYRDEDKAAVEFLPLRSENEPNSRCDGGSKSTRRRIRAETKANMAALIEKYAFASFAFIFLVFCILFWSWLLIGSGYFVWDMDKDINICESSGN